MDPLLHAIPPDTDRRRVAVLLINAGLYLLRDGPVDAPASDPRPAHPAARLTTSRGQGPTEIMAVIEGRRH